MLSPQSKQSLWAPSSASSLASAWRQEISNMTRQVEPRPAGGVQKRVQLTCKKPLYSCICADQLGQHSVGKI